MKKGSDTPLSSMMVANKVTSLMPTALQFGHPQCVEGRPKSFGEW